MTALDAETPAEVGPEAVPGGVLGVIAGAGALPRLAAEAEARRGGAVFVLGLSGFAESWIEAWPHERCALGQAGKLFSTLKKQGCDRVCFAGGLSRPSLVTLAKSLRFDLTAMRLAPQVARLLRRGDDGLLRGLAELFEARGFQLIAAQSLLGELLAPAGAIGRRAPSPRDLEDMARAAEIVAALGAVDVGQGAVVAHGRCLAVETVFGTDWMLASLVGQKRRQGAPIPSGVLFKAPKPEQDERLDWPTIGPRTIAAVKAAGLNGVALAAGGVFILDIVETAAAADAAGVFLFGREADAAAPGAPEPQA
ncbi:MAG: UDP-2,3-diacylglucosamine diphosphatase LpxI [Pseudomonadota bacterium]